ncbi:hypothetical protein NEOKW01_1372 [Nematocida sp. AWRm80]|nr:hypothetical protein NEOKW01_1372 [Nematocida sp. AWRm80]
MKRTLALSMGWLYLATCTMSTSTSTGYSTQYNPNAYAGQYAAGMPGSTTPISNGFNTQIASGNNNIIVVIKPLKLTKQMYISSETAHITEEQAENVNPTTGLPSLVSDRTMSFVISLIPTKLSNSRSTQQTPQTDKQMFTVENNLGKLLTVNKSTQEIMMYARSSNSSAQQWHISMELSKDAFKFESKQFPNYCLTVIPMTAINTNKPVHSVINNKLQLRQCISRTDYVPSRPGEITPSMDDQLFTLTVLTPLPDPIQTGVITKNPMQALTTGGAGGGISNENIGPLLSTMATSIMNIEKKILGNDALTIINGQQGIPGQALPGQQMYPGQTYPGQMPSAIPPVSQTYPGQQEYPGQVSGGIIPTSQTYPGQTYPSPMTGSIGSIPPTSQTYPGVPSGVPGESPLGYIPPMNSMPGSSTFPPIGSGTNPLMHNPSYPYTTTQIDTPSSPYASAQRGVHPASYSPPIVNSNTGGVSGYPYSSPMHTSNTYPGSNNYHNLTTSNTYPGSSNYHNPTSQTMPLPGFRSKYSSSYLPESYQDPSSLGRTHNPMYGHPSFTQRPAMAGFA